MTRISEVSKEVINRASAGVDVLEPSSHNSQHGQPPVLDLLGPQLLDLLGRAGAPPKWIEPEPARVPDVGSCELVVGEDGVGVDAPGLDDVSPSPALGPADENELNDEEGGGVGEVLLLPGGVPRGSVEDANLREELRDENAGGSEHGPSAVDQLRLLVPSQALRIRPEAKRIEAEVSWEAAVEPRRRSASWEPEGPIRISHRADGGQSSGGCSRRGVLAHAQPFAGQEGGSILLATRRGDGHGRNG